MEGTISKEVVPLLRKRLADTFLMKCGCCPKKKAGKKSGMAALLSDICQDKFCRGKSEHLDHKLRRV